MRDDFAKLLTERERRGHDKKYREVRHLKGFGVHEIGGRESMKLRHNKGYNRKSFNENLNPLKGWLRTCVGKPWDKSYSELRKKFDARKVVNNHILEHLFDYVETRAFLKDGKVFYLDKRDRYQKDGRVRPIKESMADYYVCPKNGTLKTTNRVPHRAITKQREAEKLKAKLAVMRVLDDGSELHLVDGIWFHYTFATLSKANLTYTKPIGQNEFRIGYWFEDPAHQTIKSWDDLNQLERERFGMRTYDVQGVVDALTGKRISPSTTQEVRYACTKRTASNKILKAEGLDGALPDTEVCILSHREWYASNSRNG